MGPMRSFAEATGREMGGFRFGWNGDSGLGEYLLEKILAGRKTATTCPSYDPEEGLVGAVLPLVDKAGKPLGRIRITRVELRPYGSFDQELAQALGGKDVDEVRKMLSFANSRELGPEEEMRVTYFELLK